MACLPAAHFFCFACVMCFVASHVHILEEERQAQGNGDAPECMPAEASATKTVSLLQVQGHSANWPRRAKGSTKAELAKKALGAHRPTGLPPMHEAASDASRESPTSAAPCSCEVDSLLWAQPAPRAPRCIFIDLGAADGNTFQHFLKNGYGEVGNCPSGGEYEAILVEANPMFDKELLKLQANFSGRVRSLVSSAAYMCEGFTSFYLDTVDVQQNYWGSSMSPNANDVKRSGKKHVRVPLVNVARLIMENTLPDDYVLVKIDIEGSEHDILPCLAQSRAAFLIDAIYVEKHPIEWSLAGAPGALQAALATLQERGIVIPEYSTAS